MYLYVLNIVCPFSPASPSRHSYVDFITSHVTSPLCILYYCILIDDGEFSSVVGGNSCLVSALQRAEKPSPNRNKPTESEGQCARSNKPFSSRPTQKWPRNLIIHAQSFYLLPVTLWFVSMCGPNENRFTIVICEVQRNALHFSLRLSIVYPIQSTSKFSNLVQKTTQFIWILSFKSSI